MLRVKCAGKQRVAADVAPLRSATRLSPRRSPSISCIIIYRLAVNGKTDAPDRDLKACLVQLTGGRFPPNWVYDPASRPGEATSEPLGREGPLICCLRLSYWGAAPTRVPTRRSQVLSLLPCDVCPADSAPRVFPHRLAILHDDFHAAISDGSARHWRGNGVSLSLCGVASTCSRRSLLYSPLIIF